MPFPIVAQNVTGLASLQVGLGLHPTSRSRDAMVLLTTRRIANIRFLEKARGLCYGGTRLVWDMVYLLMYSG